MEIQVHPYDRTRDGKTPDDIACGHVGDTDAIEESTSGMNTADRIALAAIFSASILILVMFELTDKSAMQVMHAAATVAMRSYASLPVSKPERRKHSKHTVATTAERE
jgi:hypothetical protein